jgi:hypothetical protein
MYRDYPPQDTSFPTEVFPFTRSLEEMQANVNKMQAQGGGDYPECVRSTICHYKSYHLSHIHLFL